VCITAGLRRLEKGCLLKLCTQFGSFRSLQFVRSAAGLVKGCDNVAATRALAAREVHAAVLLDVKEYGGRDGSCDRRGEVLDVAAVSGCCDPTSVTSSKCCGCFLVLRSSGLQHRDTLICQTPLWEWEWVLEREWKWDWLQLMRWLRRATFIDNTPIFFTVR
jgi:hypothetical protein